MAKPCNLCFGITTPHFLIIFSILCVDPIQFYVHTLHLKSAILFSTIAIAYPEVHSD